MDEGDRIILTLDAQRTTHPTLIACLYTGAHLPRFCAPMPRHPNPPTGMPFDQSFPSAVSSALSTNTAVHDGAVMIGRPTVASAYRIVGWSYRLFPPVSQLAGTPNRGSAFNSCLAMSCVETIDGVYLVSTEGVFRFMRDRVEHLRQRLPQA